MQKYLSKQGQNRLLHNAMKQKCFLVWKQRLSYHRLFSMYTSRCKEINIKYMKTNVDHTQFISKYGSDEVTKKTLENCIIKVGILCMERHDEVYRTLNSTEERMEYVNARMHSLNGGDFLRAYILAVFPNILFTKEVRKRSSFINELYNSSIDLFMTFEKIMTELIKHTAYNINILSAKLTRNFMDKYYCFGVDYDVFFKHDANIVLYYKSEHYRSLQCKKLFLSSLQNPSAVHSDCMEIIKDEHDISLNEIMDNIRSFSGTVATRVSMKLLETEVKWLRFLNNFFRCDTTETCCQDVILDTLEQTKVNKQWMSVSRCQGLSLENFLIARQSLYIQKEVDQSNHGHPVIGWDVYNCKSIYDLDWSFEESVHHVLLESNFRYSMQETSRNLQFKLSCNSIDGLNEFLKNGAANQLKNDKYSFKSIAVVNQMYDLYGMSKKLMEFGKCLSNVCLDDVEIGTIKQFCSAIEMEHTFMNPDVLVSMNVMGLDGKWFTLFLKECRSLFNVLLISSQLHATLGSTVEENHAKSSDNFVKYLTVSWVSLEQRLSEFVGVSSYDTTTTGKIIIEVIQFLKESSVYLMIVYANKIIDYTKEVIDMVVVGSTGEDSMHCIVKYISDEFGKKIEKYGLDVVLFNTQRHISSVLENTAQIELYLKANVQSKYNKCELLHHCFLSSVIVKSQYIENFPETLWKSMFYMAEIKREFELCVKIVYSKLVFSDICMKYGVIMSPEITLELEQTFGSMMPKYTPEETFYQVYDAIRSSVQKSGMDIRVWNEIKPCIVDVSNDFFRHVKVQIISMVFNIKETSIVSEITYTPAIFLSTRLERLKTSYTNLRVLDFDIHKTWYTNVFQCVCQGFYA